jgi:hypothetical protein
MWANFSGSTSRRSCIIARSAAKPAAVKNRRGGLLCGSSSYEPAVKQALSGGSHFWLAGAWSGLPRPQHQPLGDGRKRREVAVQFVADVGALCGGEVFGVVGHPPLIACHPSPPRRRSRSPGRSPGCIRGQTCGRAMD